MSRFYKATRGIPEIIAALGLLFLALAFGFVSDRTIDIRAQLQPQYQHFDALSVAGDLTGADISAAEALQPFYDDYIRSWTLQSTSPIDRPSTVKLPLPDQRDQYVYFTEVLHDHFMANYEGYGTFTSDTHTASKNETMQAQDDSDKSKNGDQSTTLILNDGTEVPLRRNVRWPRWGIRTHCQRLENLSRYLVPDISQSANASVDDRKAVFFLTHEVLGSVLSTLNVSLPSSYKKPANLSTTYGDLHNVLPAGLKAADVAVAKFFAADGVAQAFWSQPIRSDEEVLLDEASSRYSPGSAGRGWVSLEVILIRLNQTLAGPGAQFGMVANVSDQEGRFGNIGFDIAVCVERLDPYVVEVDQGLNSVRSASIVRQADDLTLDDGQRRSSLASAVTTSNLSSKGKYAAYILAHESARNALIKDNGRDHSWVPNPTLMSVSSGAGGGPTGYGVLDPLRLADMLANV
ncbi:unnamed protein product, partial [Tilletia laevis]